MPQRPAYAQPYVPEHQCSIPQQQSPQCITSPFLLTMAPNGMPWFEYVKVSTIFMDGSTGMLAGPWAECLCWAVHFEHSSDWQSMPEYVVEGPAGGVLEALQARLVGRMDAQQLLGAAERLEEAAHAAADAGHPLPVIYSCVGRGPVQYSGHMTHVDEPSYGQAIQVPNAPPMHSQALHGQPGYSHPAYAQSYGETPYLQPPQGYDQQSYGEPPNQGFGGGPTLLQQQAQNQGGGSGMGVGGKMALAAAGGVAAGVGGYYLATHMDDVGDAIGGAAGFVGNAGEAAFDHVRNGVEDVGEFIEDMF